MKHFLDNLYVRDAPLYLFGCCNFLAALIFLSLTRVSSTIVSGVNAWFKPFKFALSIAIYSWTMGWFTYELHCPALSAPYNWITIVLLGFEVVYIALQAGRGQLSHFNTSSSIYLLLFNIMGLAAAIATLWTASIAILFFTTDLPTLPNYYVWSIRIGMIIFVIFSLQGAVMGGKAGHSVGGPDGGPALPFLKWSTKFGDLRVAHFVGMHALQILPLLSWYILKNALTTIAVGLLYACLATCTFIQAIQGRPLIKKTGLP